MHANAIIKLVLIVLLFCSLVSVCSAEISEWRKIDNLRAKASDEGRYDDALRFAKKAFIRARYHEHKRLPISCAYLGDAYYEHRDFKLAPKYFSCALWFWKKAYGVDSSLVASIYILFSKNYLAQGEYNKAEHYALRSLHILDKILDKSDSDRVAVLINLGRVYAKQGDYAKAELRYKQAEVILDTESSLDLSNYWGAVASLYKRTGRYNESEQMYLKLLALDQKKGGPNHPDTAITLHNLGALYLTQGLYYKALPLLLRAVNISEQYNNNLHLDGFLSSLGLVYQRLGEYSNAKAAYDRAVILNKKIHADGRNFAAFLSNYADLYKLLGDYAKSEELYNQALAINKRVLPKDHMDIGRDMGKLAGVYHLQGDSKKAESFYQESIAIMEKSLGNEHPEVATLLNNLANIYKEKRDFKEAKQMYLQAIDVNEKSFPTDSPLQADVINNLAVLYLNTHEYAEAEKFLLRSMATREKGLGVNHPLVAESLNNLAMVYSEQKLYNKAEPLYQRAIQIIEKSNDHDNPTVVTYLNNLANLYVDKGEYDLAKPIFEKAIAIGVKRLGPVNPTVLEVKRNLKISWWKSWFIFKSA